MAQYILGGIGKPKIIFDDGSFVVFPEPNGNSRDGIEAYDFEENYLSRYRSEGNKEVTVGKKEIFIANLKWLTLNKYYYYKLLQAQNQGSFKFILHEDEPTIYYYCRCRVKARIIAGLVNNPSGYSVEVSLRGVDFSTNANLGPLSAGTGYGTSYGTESGNQSP